MEPKVEPPLDPSLAGPKAVDLLAKEYEFHRSEIMKRLEMSHQQNTYLQVFLAALVTVTFAVAEFLHGGSDSQFAKAIKSFVSAEKPIVVVGIATALLIGTGITWYFITSLSEMYYMFNLLRLRMREIESEINRLVGRDVWTYESRYVPRYITEPFPLGPRLNPIVFSVIMRLLCMLSIALMFLILASLLLPPVYRLSFNTVFILGTLWILVSSFKEVLPGIRQDLTKTQAGKFSLWLGWLYHVGLALTFIGILLSLQQLAVYFPTVAKLQRWTDGLSASFFGSIAFSFTWSAVTLIPFAPPSELPMILVPAHGWTPILASCAMGRALASVLMCYLYTSLDHLLKGRLTLFARSTNWIITLIRNYSTLGFLATQAIPFFPMRSGLVGYMALKNPRRWSVFWCTALGTIIRDTVMFLAIKYGLLPLYRLFNQ